MDRIRDYLNTHTNPPVFLVSLVLTVALVLWGAMAPGNLGEVAGAVKVWISTYFGWWYLASVTFFLIFVLVLLLSPFGRIRLGKDNERPTWSTWSWFSMLFTAGMGIGLVFFGVAEPIFHFNTFNTEGDLGGISDKAAAAREAMRMTIFHWGLHPWAIYIIVGLSMGYFCFRYDMPLRPASAFYPLIGKRIYGWTGHLIDILAVFGTLFGLATSLGLGATQINAGLHQVFNDIPIGATTQVAIIAVVTGVAVLSLMLGVDKGIRRLSVFNMYIAIALAVVVFIAGPTLFILNFTVQSTGDYLQRLTFTSLRSWAFSSDGRGWLDGWTLFYWGWWIAWSPFVGMFIARVSRGRTIREFILGTLLAPVGASVVWFCIFGGSALYFLVEGGNEALAGAGTDNALFILLQQLPLFQGVATALSLLAIMVIAIFFATSSDSGSLVVDMLTNGGDPHPIWQQRLFWALMEGAVAAVLLVAGWAAYDALVATGDENANPRMALSALQTASILSGLPFSVVLVFMCVGLMRQLRNEDLEGIPTPEPPAVAEMEVDPSSDESRWAEDDVKQQEKL